MASSARMSGPIKSIKGVLLPGRPQDTVWDVFLEDSIDGNHTPTISSITPHRCCSPSQPRARPHHPLLLPALTHPHVHLDKAHVHSAAEYAHLLPAKGSFQEALEFTTQAKERFARPDLLQRGEWLLADSVASGVSAMRAFVEVDHTVQTVCLEVGIELKERWADRCHMQLACFAQDPIFSGQYGEENRRLMEEAIRLDSVDVIGTTPYVESNLEASKKSIEWAIDRALELRKHVDFHLDYNLDREREPLVWHVIRTLQRKKWTTQPSSSNGNKQVMLGHCTRLTLFDNDEWRRLAREIELYNLPVSFVGLPTSDLYMAAPPVQGDQRPPHEQPRATLQVPKMIRELGLDAVIGVNNVGNAFTPWGSADPLSLACLGVGIYQAGTQADAELLYACVSTRARAAIGLPVGDRRTPVVKQGDSADFLLIRDLDETGWQVVPRARKSFADIVWDPPANIARNVVFQGRLAKMARYEQNEHSLSRLDDIITFI